MLIEELKSLFIRNKPFTTMEAAEQLGVSLSQASKTLYDLGKQGHLYKIKKGLYLPVPHKGLTPEETFSDPWQIVPTLFAKGCVGGWSAATHWGLTEQLFRRTCIVTSGKVHYKTLKLGRFEYILFSQNDIPRNELEFISRNGNLVPVSDVHKTVIDMLYNPDCGAGIQHTIDCLKIYFSEYYDETTFISRTTKIKTGVFFKRLGYISEVLYGTNHPLCILSQKHITKGASKIDPKMKCEKLVTRWNLYINEGITI